MSTTELSVAWFAQSACSHSVTREFESQLSENEFDGSTVSIDAASISQQSLTRFKNLRAVEVNGQVLFPASHFDDADDFGWQFLSHAVYESLLGHHITDLRSKSKKIFEIALLGEVQNQFFFDSSPELFFFDAAEWDKRKLQKKILEFRIDRPEIKVCDFVISQTSVIRRTVSSGKRYKDKEPDHLPQTDNSTDISLSPSSDEIESWLQSLNGLVLEIADARLAKDFLDFINSLEIYKHCDNCAVTPDRYQQFMNEWESAPQPIQGATWIQGLLWKWLYVRFPHDRSKFFDGQNDSGAVKHKKSVARSRRLNGLNELLKNAAARGAS